MGKRLLIFLFCFAFILTVGFFLINGHFNYEDISNTEYDDYVLFERFLVFTEIVDEYTTNVTSTLQYFKKVQFMSFSYNPFSEYFGNNFGKTINEFDYDSQFEKDLQEGLLSPPKNFLSFLTTIFGPFNNFFYYVLPVVCFIIMNVVYLVKFIWNVLVYLFSPVPKWSM